MPDLIDPPVQDEIATLQKELHEARAALVERDRWIQSQLLEKRKADDRLEAANGELTAYIQQRNVLLNLLRRLYSSPSWKLTGPLRFVRSLLKPLAATDREIFTGPGMLRDTDGTWSSTVVLPQLLLPCQPMMGWVKLRLSIASEAPSRARLFYDTGSLFNEAESIDVGPVSADTTREFCFHLPQPVHCFRLDPIRKPGKFVIRHFSITPLNRLRSVVAAAKMRWNETDRKESIGPAVRRSLWQYLSGESGRARQSFRSILNRQRPDKSDEYDLWRQSRKLTDAGRAEQTAWAKSLAAPPLLSILIPTYNTPDACLRECIQSVLDQTYPHWELCIADDASSKKSVRPTLDFFARQDPRIKVQIREKNGNISAASNTALAMATGSHIVLLDHDDLLAPHALYSVAKRLIDNPALDILYSDEDKLTPEGRHIDPFFKPDWSPDFLLSCMYTSHLSVYRLELVREIGGFRSEFDGSQDYDLLLRLTTRTTPDRIAHIPDVLYHWRMLDTSTASNTGAKPYTWDASRRAIQSYLASRNLPATVEPGPSHGLHHIRYTLVDRPLVSIIIPSACRPLKSEGNGSTAKTYLARQCIESIRAHSTYDRIELILASPASIPTELRDWLQSIDVRIVHYPQPFNFSEACNTAAAAARGKHLLFLNDDTLVRSPDFVEQMLCLSQLPEVGAVGARLFFPDGRLQHCGVIILDGNPCHAFEQYPGNHPGYFGSNTLIRNWIAVTGACLMTRRDAFESVGGFDVEFPMNYNDIDYCLRLREVGLRTVCNPQAQLIHVASASTEGHYPHETRRFKNRWETRLAVDPFYNPNLSCRTSDFRIES
jgi:GT2 family glycosyltransferase